MRVLQVLRVDAGLYYGGGEVQAERTREALTDLGVEVRVHAPLNSDLGDVVHFFGLFDSHWEIARYCLSKGVPYVVSPIFVTPRTVRRLRWRSFRQRFLDFRFPREHHALLQNASAIFPLTQFEQRNIQTFFPGLPDERFHLVPNGVEERFASADPEVFRSEFQMEGDFVLHAATIDRTKNQLGVIRAMKGLGVPLVLLGRVQDEAFWKQCQAEMEPTMRHLGSLPHTGELLPSAFAAAKVFCLPSRREILPLSAMEASAAGCHLVLGAHWGGQEIWDGLAQFVDPGDSSAIARAIQDGLQQPGRNTWGGDFLARYRWSSVGALLKQHLEAVPGE